MQDLPGSMFHASSVNEYNKFESLSRSLSLRTEVQLVQSSPLGKVRKGSRRQSSLQLRFLGRETRMSSILIYPLNSWHRSTLIGRSLAIFLPDTAGLDKN